MILVICLLGAMCWVPTGPTVISLQQKTVTVDGQTIPFVSADLTTGRNPVLTIRQDGVFADGFE